MDLVISVHLNASDGNGPGFEFLYYDQIDLPG
ncbi:N-acetylmuramoyl-L-alanine amidase [Bacillus thuringiensis serovar israelensis ATCC 35646]|nr:N-acetylmuramoyl-L-alanine amidase [Bacillus thuringiensis serovar israelensis ATCC 35646]